MREKIVSIERNLKTTIMLELSEINFKHEITNMFKDSKMIVII